MGGTQEIQMELGVHGIPRGQVARGVLGHGDPQETKVALMVLTEALMGLKEALMEQKVAPMEQKEASKHTMPQKVPTNTSTTRNNRY